MSSLISSLHRLQVGLFFSSELRQAHVHNYASFRFSQRSWIINFSKENVRFFMPGFSWNLSDASSDIHHRLQQVWNWLSFIVNDHKMVQRFRIWMERQHDGPRESRPTFVQKNKGKFYSHKQFNKRGQTQENLWNWRYHCHTEIFNSRNSSEPFEHEEACARSVPRILTFEEKYRRVEMAK